MPTPQARAALKNTGAHGCMGLALIADVLRSKVATWSCLYYSFAVGPFHHCKVCCQHHRVQKCGGVLQEGAMPR